MRHWLIAIVLLLAAIGAYVAAYYAMIVRLPSHVPWSPTFPASKQMLLQRRIAVYRFGGTPAVTIFAPIHRFDYWLRARHWHGVDNCPAPIRDAVWFAATCGPLVSGHPNEADADKLRRRIVDTAHDVSLLHRSVASSTIALILTLDAELRTMLGE